MNSEQGDDSSSSSTASIEGTEYTERDAKSHEEAGVTDSNSIESSKNLKAPLFLLALSRPYHG